MKKLVKVQEIEAQGLVSLLGKKVVLMCLNFIYTGELTGVNDTCVELKEPSIIYDTGSWSNDTWDDKQSLCVDTCYVQTGVIESFFETVK